MNEVEAQEASTSIKSPKDAIHVKTSKKAVFLNADAAASVFRSLHNEFETLRRSRICCDQRAYIFMTEPLYIFAILAGLDTFASHYAQLSPRLAQLQITKDANLVSFPATAHLPLLNQHNVLRDIFDLESLTSSLTTQPLLTRTQRNKLKRVSSDRNQL